MECWTRIKRITIEKAILFLKLTLEDMIKRKFTPGGLVAIFESAENEINPLMILPWGA